MAKGVNKVILLGGAVKDPDIRSTAGGLNIANVVLGTTEEWKDKQSGEKKEHSEYHNLVWFGKSAQLIGDYVQKGTQLYIEGSIRTEKYQKNGEDKYITKIHVKEWKITSKGKMSGASANRGDDAPPDFGDDIPY